MYEFALHKPKVCDTVAFDRNAFHFYSYRNCDRPYSNYTNYSFLKVWVLCTVTTKKSQCCNKVTVHRRKHCPVILLIGYCGFKQLSHCLQEFVPQVINIDQWSFLFSQPLGIEMFRSFCMRFKSKQCDKKTKQMNTNISTNEYYIFQNVCVCA